jgi:hypothetical protein
MSPDTVTRRIRELSAIGFNHFLMVTATAGIPKEVRTKSPIMRLRFEWL